jgi:CRP-like cAMP-binding protein
MMVVEQGEVRITYPSPDGKEVLLSELKPGTIFGEIALLDGGERSADATAGAAATLLVFERKDFMAMLQGNWPLAEAILKMVCARLRRADQRMADLAFHDLPERLAKALVSRAKMGPEGKPRVTDSLSALGTIVGGSRDALNRYLKKWEGEGLIAVGEGRITILDSDGLRRATA